MERSSTGRPREIFGRLVAEGTVMPSAGVWHGRTVIPLPVVQSTAVGE
jgi:hypothetical protein